MKAAKFKGPEDFSSIIQLLDYFDTEEKCIRYFQWRRWDDRPKCPHCGNQKKSYAFKDGLRFKCADCRKQYTVKVGTIFQDSKIPLRKWFVAIYMVICPKKGVSSHQLARDIKVTQKTAWFMLQRVRHQLGIENDPTEQLDGIVEADETFVGGKNKNRHWNKKVKKSQGRSCVDKTPVFGMVERDGKVKTVVIKHTGATEILPHLLTAVKPGATLMTDDWNAYHGLNRIYEQGVVNHGRKEFGDSFVNTNTIEGYWAWLKRAIMGVWHHVSPEHLQFYCHEVTYRYNTRTLKQGERLQHALTLPAAPLKYRELINNAHGGKA